MTIEKNYKNFHILESELQAVRKVFCAAAIIADVEGKDEEMIENIGDNEKEIYKNKKIEEKIRETKDRSEKKKSQNEMQIEI
jgi:hypothetical protein